MQRLFKSRGKSWCEQARKSAGKANITIWTKFNKIFVERFDWLKYKQYDWSEEEHSGWSDSGSDQLI
jgi:hypothetical protein